MPATCDKVDFDLRIAEFKINGYVVLEDMLAGDTIDRVREAFLPLLQHVQERETEESNAEVGDVREGKGRLQVTNRYTLTIPWVEPFADPEIFEHPVILEFLERYWGTDDFVIVCYHSNNPYPGSEFQRWHRDTGIGRDIPHIGLEKTPIVGVKFPLVETSEENGSIEVLPSTQYLADPDLETRYDEILRAGRFPSSHRLNMKKGSMWVQDVRTLHRGTPNRSAGPRPELVVCYCRPFWSINQVMEMKDDFYEGLSERGKKLLVRRQAVDW
jgi:ectoine hydroxylase-related dioxygenase (phytanoyl-CoA dioxygenase family)